MMETSADDEELEPIPCDEYIVENILDKKIEFGKIFYLIKWKDWPDEANTWEPIDNCGKCDKLLAEFEASRSAKKRSKKQSSGSSKSSAKFFSTLSDLSSASGGDSSDSDGSTGYHSRRKKKSRRIERSKKTRKSSSRSTRAKGSSKVQCKPTTTVDLVDEDTVDISTENMDELIDGKGLGKSKQSSKINGSEELERVENHEKKGKSKVKQSKHSKEREDSSHVKNGSSAKDSINQPSFLQTPVKCTTSSKNGKIKNSQSACINKARESFASNNVKTTPQEKVFEEDDVVHKPVSNKRAELIPPALKSSSEEESSDSEDYYFGYERGKEVEKVVGVMPHKDHGFLYIVQYTDKEIEALLPSITRAKWPDKVIQFCSSRIRHTYLPIDVSSLRKDNSKDLNGDDKENLASSANSSLTSNDQSLAQNGTSNGSPIRDDLSCHSAATIDGCISPLHNGLEEVSQLGGKADDANDACQDDQLSMDGHFDTNGAVEYNDVPIQENGEHNATGKREECIVLTEGSEFMIQHDDEDDEIQGENLSNQEILNNLEFEPSQETDNVPESSHQVVQSQTSCDEFADFEFEIPPTTPLTSPLRDDIFQIEESPPPRPSSSSSSSVSSNSDSSSSSSDSDDDSLRLRRKRQRKNA